MHVAQHFVSLNSDSAFGDAFEALQVDRFQVGILEENHRVALEERLTVNSHQVREELRDRLESRHAIDDQEVGDLREQGKRNVVEIFGAQLNYFHRAFNHRATFQASQAFNVVASLNIATN